MSERIDSLGSPELRAVTIRIQEIDERVSRLENNIKELSDRLDKLEERLAQLAELVHALLISMGRAEQERRSIRWVWRPEFYARAV